MTQEPFRGFIPQQLEDVTVQARRVFVGGVSWKANEKSLGAYFSSFGDVEECKIIMDKITGKSKGYAFVTFATLESALKVKRAPKLEFLGKSMNVGDAKRKPSIRQVRQQNSQFEASNDSPMVLLGHQQQQVAQFQAFPSQQQQVFVEGTSFPPGYDQSSMFYEQPQSFVTAYQEPQQQVYSKLQQQQPPPQQISTQQQSLLPLAPQFPGQQGHENNVESSKEGNSRPNEEQFNMPPYVPQQYFVQPQYMLAYQPMNWPVSPGEIVYPPVYLPQGGDYATPSTYFGVEPTGISGVQTPETRQENGDTKTETEQKKTPPNYRNDSRQNGPQKVSLENAQYSA